MNNDSSYELPRGRDRIEVDRLPMIWTVMDLANLHVDNSFGTQFQTLSVFSHSMTDVV